MAIGSTNVCAQNYRGEVSGFNVKRNGRDSYYVVLRLHQRGESDPETRITLPISEENYRQIELKDGQGVDPRMVVSMNLNITLENTVHG